MWHDASRWCSVACFDLSNLSKASLISEFATSAARLPPVRTSLPMTSAPLIRIGSALVIMAFLMLSAICAILTGFSTENFASTSSSRANNDARLSDASVLQESSSCSELIQHCGLHHADNISTQYSDVSLPLCKTCHSRLHFFVQIGEGVVVQVTPLGFDIRPKRKHSCFRAIFNLQRIEMSL